MEIKRDEDTNQQREEDIERQRDIVIERQRAWDKKSCKHKKRF